MAGSRRVTTAALSHALVHVVYYNRASKFYNFPSLQKGLSSSIFLSHIFARSASTSGLDIVEDCTKLEWARGSGFNPNVPVEEAETLPSGWYTSTKVAQAEMHHVFGKGWLAVGHGAQVQKAGDFFTGSVGPLRFVVCRDEAGTLRAFHNVCRHHAAAVACGAGSAADFVCPYHGWTYSLDGRLKKATRLGGIKNFSAKDYGLRPLASAEWGPFILISQRSGLPAKPNTDSNIRENPNANPASIPTPNLHLISNRKPNPSPKPNPGPNPSPNPNPHASPEPHPNSSTNPTSFPTPNLHLILNRNHNPSPRRTPNPYQSLEPKPDPTSYPNVNPNPTPNPNDNPHPNPDPNVSPNTDIVPPAQKTASDSIGEEWLGSAAAVLEAAGVADPRMRHVARREYELNCNWKVYVDNYLDGGYHVPHAHQALAAELDMASYQSCLLERGSSVQRCGSSSRDGRLGQASTYCFVYPNFMINRYGPWMDTNTVLPLGVAKCKVVFDWFLHSDSPLANDSAYIEASIAASHTVQVEDVGLCERVQEGLFSPAYDVGRYVPKVEQPMHHFHCLLYNDVAPVLGTPP